MCQSRGGSGTGDPVQTVQGEQRLRPLKANGCPSQQKGEQPEQEQPLCTGEQLTDSAVVHRCSDYKVCVGEPRVSIVWCFSPTGDIPMDVHSHCCRARPGGYAVQGVSRGTILAWLADIKSQFRRENNCRTKHQTCVRGSLHDCLPKKYGTYSDRLRQQLWKHESFMLWQHFNVSNASSFSGSRTPSSMWPRSGRPLSTSFCVNGASGVLP